MTDANPSSCDRLCATLAREPELTLLLDLDGTLIPFAATTEATILDAQLLATLADLVAARVRVIVVSGRPRRLIERFATQAPDLTWIAEHGTWRREAGGDWTGPPPIPEIHELAIMLDPLQRIPGARLEAKSWSICLHWRLVPLALKEQLIAAAELACDEWLESHPDFERIEGVEMIEVRRIAANKGAAVVWVRERFPGARIIAIGDDETDEDMFAALHGHELAIGVGSRRTRVACALPDHLVVRDFLAWLVLARTNDVQPFLSKAAVLAHTLAAQARLLVVSNRIPPTTSGRERSVGGLVSAIGPALQTYDGMWLGWSGCESEGDRRVMIDDSERPIRAAFDFPPTWREQFYSGFCNRTLWPLFHGFLERTRFADADWACYVAANAEFANRAHDLVAPDGTVWVHDYHLLLAGRDLRTRGFRGALGLFLHIPFPQRDTFETLPWAEDVLDAMLQFDLVGFHTERWAGNFRDCVRARFGDRRLPQIGVLPIGVDPLTFEVENDPTDRELVGLRGVLGPRRLILGVDRLDYAKGIPERLLAYERLLENHAEWRGQVVFVQISVPSRADVPEYAQLRAKVETLVGRINGRFGEADWVPVRYLYRSYDHAVLAQLYRMAEIALVTPLRDGLNLVAKEFVVSQDADNPGVLVLSQFAGAAAELVDAVITNPFHVDGLARDLDRALRMDVVERRRRHALLSATLANQTPARWAAVFLDRLLSAERSLA